MIKLQILQNLMQGRFRFAQFYQKTFQFILTHFKEAKIHFILNFVFIYNRVNMVKIAENFFLLVLASEKLSMNCQLLPLSVTKKFVQECQERFPIQKGNTIPQLIPHKIVSDSAT